MDFVRITKTILPAVVVLVAGLFGVNFVYNTYLQDGSASVITLEPAAGEEGVTVSVEDGATSVSTAVGDTVVTTTTETVVEPVDVCATAQTAAEAAVGTDKAAEAAKAAADCEAAKEAKAAADVKVDTATEAAVDAAVEGATEHLPVTEGDVPAAVEEKAAQ